MTPSEDFFLLIDTLFPQKLISTRYPMKMRKSQKPRANVNLILPAGRELKLENRLYYYLFD